MSVGLFDSFITCSWYNAEARRLWSDRSTLRFWLKVEGALALAQGELGMIPRDAACAIARCAETCELDHERLGKEIEFAQHPFVPVLRQFEAACGEPAADYVHLGATTQNIFDTAAALQMLDTHRLTREFLGAALAQLARLAEQHKATLQAGRTHGQHALPMTFGFKLAGWIEELVRHRQRLDGRVRDSFVASMGGAIGTFSAMSGQGPNVEQHVAHALGLRPAGLPARASYDRVSDYVSALSLLAATIEKLARDIVFLQRTEIAEVAEAFHPGKMGSSTMAQKRNPATALMLISQCRMLRSRATLLVECMVRMDEGDSSATNVSDSTLPEVAVLAVSVAENLAKLSEGLVVDAEAMSRNVALTHGLIVSEALMMRLATDLGRPRAHHLLYEASQRAVAERIPLLQAIREHSLLSGGGGSADLGEALAPDTYVGESVRLTEAAVAHARQSG